MPVLAATIAGSLASCMLMVKVPRSTPFVCNVDYDENISTWKKRIADLEKLCETNNQARYRQKLKFFQDIVDRYFGEDVFVLVNMLPLIGVDSYTIELSTKEILQKFRKLMHFCTALSRSFMKQYTGQNLKPYSFNSRHVLHSIPTNEFSFIDVCRICNFANPYCLARETSLAHKQTHWENITKDYSNCDTNSCNQTIC